MSLAFIQLQLRHVYDRRIICLSDFFSRPYVAAFNRIDANITLSSHVQVNGINLIHNTKQKTDETTILEFDRLSYCVHPINGGDCANWQTMNAITGPQLPLTITLIISSFLIVCEHIHINRLTK